MSDCRQILEEFSVQALPTLDSLGPTFRFLIGHRIPLHSIAIEPAPIQRKLLDVPRLATTKHLSYRPECFLHLFLRFAGLPSCDQNLLLLIHKFSAQLGECSWQGNAEGRLSRRYMP